VANKPKHTYYSGMDFIREVKKDVEHLSGQELTNFISVVHEEFKIATNAKEPPYITLYYRDLLSYLIKTYGH